MIPPRDEAPRLPGTLVPGGRARRGFALVLALVMLSLLFVLGLAYGARTSSQLAATTRAAGSVQASYLAESGLRYALYAVDGSALPSLTTLGFETGSVTVSVADLGQGRRGIHSRASAGRVQRSLHVVVTGRGAVEQWSVSVP